MIWYDILWSEVTWHDMIWHEVKHDIWYMFYILSHVISDIWYICLCCMFYAFVMCHMLNGIWYLIFDIWYDMFWYDMIWFWYELIFDMWHMIRFTWYVMWFDMIQYAVICDMWYVIWHDTIWYHIQRYDMVSYGMIWYDMYNDMYNDMHQCICKFWCIISGIFKLLIFGTQDDQFQESAEDGRNPAPPWMVGSHK